MASEPQSIVEEYKKQIKNLQAKIAKAVAAIETAELGEGYAYNLRRILEDLK